MLERDMFDRLEKGRLIFIEPAQLDDIIHNQTELGWVIAHQDNAYTNHGAEYFQRYPTPHSGYIDPQFSDREAADSDEHFTTRMKLLPKIVIDFDSIQDGGAIKKAFDDDHILSDLSEAERLQGNLDDEARDAQRARKNIIAIREIFKNRDYYIQLFQTQ